MLNQHVLLAKMREKVNSIVVQEASDCTEET